MALEVGTVITILQVGKQDAWLHPHFHPMEEFAKKLCADYYFLLLSKACATWAGPQLKSTGLESCDSLLKVQKKLEIWTPEKENGRVTQESSQRFDFPHPASHI